MSSPPLGLVTILGDGQFALVMADALAAAGTPVRIWCPGVTPGPSLAETRTAPRRLPDFRLDDAVGVTHDLSAALDGADGILNAIPTQFIRDVWSRPEVAAAMADGEAVPRIVCVSKGIEQESLLRPTEIIEQSVGRSVVACSLSGPTIAAELARRMPATMVAASDDESWARAVQGAFSAPWLRVYRHDDLIGTELAGAAKNVIALAAGIVDGLEAGDNAKSALLSRGLAEIARLGTSLGARVETFFGVAGVGDLATTCFSPHGRNRTCGERIGRGETLAEILASTVSVVEGVPTTRAIAALADRAGVDMPIVRAVRGVLFEDRTPDEAIRELMGREPKAERIG